MKENNQSRIPLISAFIFVTTASMAARANTPSQTPATGFGPDLAGARVGMLEEEAKAALEKYNPVWKCGHYPGSKTGLTCPWRENQSFDNVVASLTVDAGGKTRISSLSRDIKRNASRPDLLAQLTKKYGKPTVTGQYTCCAPFQYRWDFDKNGHQLEVLKRRSEPPGNSVVEVTIMLEVTSPKDVPDLVTEAKISILSNNFVYQLGVEKMDNQAAETAARNRKLLDATKGSGPRL